MSEPQIGTKKYDKPEWSWMKQGERSHANFIRYILQRRKHWLFLSAGISAFLLLLSYIMLSYVEVYRYDELDPHTLEVVGTCVYYDYPYYEEGCILLIAGIALACVTGVYYAKRYAFHMSRYERKCRSRYRQDNEDEARLRTKQWEQKRRAELNPPSQDATPPTLEDLEPLLGLIRGVTAELIRLGLLKETST